VEVHGAGGFAEVAVASEEGFEGFDEGAIAAGVGVDEGAKGLVVEFGQFVVAIEGEEQAIDAQMGERVEGMGAEEPAPYFERLLCFAKRARNVL